LAVVDLEELPLGVALPLQEAVARCRSYPPTGEVKFLVGRWDVGKGRAVHITSARVLNHCS